MRSVIVAGLAFGDEGKGACVDALTRHLDADLIVRYNGGCQAAHHVVLEDGRSHCFSQFGAGMLANNKVRTHLSRFMLVEPFSMMLEANALSKLTGNVWDRTTVDGDAVIVTYLHRRLNRLREQARGANAHGSCGRGIGIAREKRLKYGDMVLLARDVRDERTALAKLYWSANEMAPEIAEIEDNLGIRSDAPVNPPELIDSLMQGYESWPVRIVDGLQPSETMIFEGAQGVMLDETHGTAPHNTWTNTTFDNAMTLLDEVGCTDRMKIGCLRSYYTRHGAGPFPTEDKSLERHLPEPHNGNDGFQGQFRVGVFDWHMAAKAIYIVGGVDGLCISHLDYLPNIDYRDDKFLSDVKYVFNRPVVMEGRGPTAAHRKITMEVPA